MQINVTLLALLPNKMTSDSRGPATSSDKLGKANHPPEIRELFHY